MLTQCQQLLQEPDLDQAVRIGDVYGLMIECVCLFLCFFPRLTVFVARFLAASDKFQQAYTLMQELRSRVRNVNMAYYINMETIETIHRVLDIPLGHGRGGDEDNAA